MTSPVDTDDEFTELVDPDITSVHAVKGAANGTRFLLAKSAEGESVGLFDPEFVREMVAKGDDEPAADPVTMTGSPGAIARMMKAAAERAAERTSPDGEYVRFVKAKYSAEEKRRLAAQGHAMPAQGDGGEPSYPIDDQDDLGRAINAVGRGNADHDKIRKYIIGRAKAMGHADMIPDNWAADGSLKQPVAKADMFATMADPPAPADEPGSPSWEGDDASAAQSLIERLLALLPDVDALAQREGTEVGAGHMDDLADVCDLQSVRDCVTQAAKLLGSFQVSERAEAGAVAKAATITPAAPAAASLQESTVTETPADQATAAPADVAKGAATVFSEGEMARLYKEAAQKAARKAIKKAAKAAAQQMSGASAAPEDARVIPGTDTVQAPAQAQEPDEVAKAAAAQLSPFAEAMASVAKQFSELATTMGAQSERVEKALAQPDDRRSPFLNGATGEAVLAERGSGPAADPRFQAVMKAVKEMPDGPEKAQLQRTIALGAIKGTMGHAAEVASRFRQ